MLLIKSALLAILIILVSICFVMIVTTVWCYFGNVVMYLFTRDKSYIDYLKWKKDDNE